MNSEVRQIVFDKLTKFVSDFEDQNGEKAPLAICQKCNTNGPDPQCTICHGTRVFLTDEDSEMFKKCGNCDGQGFHTKNGFMTFCGQCEGKGYVDWITQIIGHLNENQFSNTFEGSAYGVTAYSGSMSSCYYPNNILPPTVGAGSSPPQTPSVGQVYYNTKDNKIKIFDGTKWNNIVGQVTKKISSIFQSVLS